MRPTQPWTSPPALLGLSLHLGGTVSDLHFPWTEEGEQADHPPVIRAQCSRGPGPGPDALPIPPPNFLSDRAVLSVL